MNDKLLPQVNSYAYYLSIATLNSQATENTYLQNLGIHRGTYLLLRGTPDIQLIVCNVGKRFNYILRMLEV